MRTSQNFDVVFNDDNNSNNKGFNTTFEQCKNWIAKHNGTSYSYFDDYKSGTVSIIDMNTDEVVFITNVK